MEKNFLKPPTSDLLTRIFFCIPINIFQKLVLLKCTYVFVIF